MRKKIFSLILMLALCTVPMTAFAEELKGGDGWEVDFDGKGMNSTFKSSDIDDAIYQMEPGDSIDISLTLRNKDTKKTDWYISNEVLQSLEDSQSVADGGVYTYVLTYENPSGESQVLYSSEAVGGEGTSTDKGLHQASSALEDYMYLDRLDTNAAGKINLRVALEGETQGNTYQNTLAKTQMTFAAEVAPTTTTTTTTRRPATVSTGDNSRIMLYVALAAFAFGAICLVIVVRMVKARGNRADRRRGSK